MEFNEPPIPLPHPGLRLRKSPPPPLKCVDGVDNIDRPLTGSLPHLHTTSDQLPNLSRTSSSSTPELSSFSRWKLSANSDSQTLPPPVFPNSARRPTLGLVNGERNSSVFDDAYYADKNANANLNANAEANLNANPAADANVDSNADAKLCRICFDSEENEDTGRLFSPCKCKGSMRYVHFQCLNQWRKVSQKRTSYVQCDFCKYRYAVKRTTLANIMTSKITITFLTLIVFGILTFLSGFLTKFMLRAYTTPANPQSSSSTSTPSSPPYLQPEADGRVLELGDLDIDLDPAMLSYTSYVCFIRHIKRSSLVSFN